MSMKLSAPSAMPKSSAWAGSIRPAGMGRDRVRPMLASMSRSNQQLMACAPPAANQPPATVAAVMRRPGQPRAAMTMANTAAGNGGGGDAQARPAARGHDHGEHRGHLEKDHDARLGERDVVADGLEESRGGEAGGGFGAGRKAHEAATPTRDALSTRPPSVACKTATPRVITAVTTTHTQSPVARAR